MRTATLQAGMAAMGHLARALKIFARRRTTPAVPGVGDELRFYRRVLAQSGDAVMIAAAGGTIEYVNAAFERLSGYAAAEIVGRRPSMFKSGEHDGPFYARLRAALEQGRSFRAVFINRNRGGSLYHEEKTISPIRDHAGRITHFVAVGRNVNARIATERRLHYLAYYDAPTGLPNRTLFRKRLDEVLERDAPAEHGLVLLLRVDDLQRINDSFGRRAADQALRVLAGRLQAFCPGDCVARWGDDVFVVLARSHTAAARRAGQGVLAVFEEPLDVGPCKLALTASVGIARYPQPARTAEEVIRQAEFDLRRSGTGSSRCSFLRHHESPGAEADRLAVGG